MIKEISKNDLNEVVLVGKGPELQTLYNIIGFNLINVGELGLNWDCINLYDELYSEFFSVLRCIRNKPKRSISIDEFLKKEYHDEIKKIKKLANMNYEIAREMAMFILRTCFEFVKIGVLK
jgi:hypothetical protein